MSFEKQKYGNSDFLNYSDPKNMDSELLKLSHLKIWNLGCLDRKILDEHPCTFLLEVPSSRPPPPPSRGFQFHPKPKESIKILANV